jgi:hypothetical protein
MAKVPRGETRPVDVISAAIAVGRISVGDAEERLRARSGRVRNGYAGAKARADALSEKKRIEVAKKAARARSDD